MCIRKYMAMMFLALLCTVTPAGAQSLVSQANEAYRNGDYVRAVELYEQSGEQDGTSAAYFYNLGNAYYKSGLYPRAILNYERALLLDPGNDDVRFNLEMAQARIADKIEPLGTFFLDQWFTTLRNLFSSNVWAVIAVAIVSCGARSVFLPASRPFLLRLGPTRLPPCPNSNLPSVRAPSFSPRPLLPRVPHRKAAPTFLSSMREPRSTSSTVWASGARYVSKTEIAAGFPPTASK